MRIIATAKAVPEHVVTNPDLEARLRLEPGWIERRTGILQRPTVHQSQATSDLAIRAGKQLLEESGFSRDAIGLLVLATSTPDHLLPPTAPLVASQLGLTNAGAFDLAGACSGFIYAMIMAEGWGQGMSKPVLVIAANVLTRRINPDDPSTAALFGDGAGAVLLEPCQPSQLLGSYLGADGSLYDLLGIPAGGSRQPLTPEHLAARRNLMHMTGGSSLFKHAVNGMVTAGREALRMAALDAQAVDWWVPHQASSRIIESAGSLLGIPLARTIRVLDRYANSSAATIPIAMADAAQTGTFAAGQLLLLTAVGAGFITAGLVVRW